MRESIAGSPRQALWPPADFAQPRFVAAVGLFPVFWARVSLARRLLANFTGTLGDRVQARRLPEFINSLAILNRPRIQFPVFVPMELRAVNLRLAFKKANPVH
jgi:hypothetical protein